MRGEREGRGGWVGALLNGTEHGLPAGRVVALIVVCLAVYGALAGFFAGGLQIALSAVKAPLIVVVATVLCLPSFVVFGIVAGDPGRPEELARRLVRGTAVAALILVALGPIVWLFSVTSRSLGFIVLVHLLAWMVALAFGLRPLRADSGSRGARRVAVLWLLMFMLVSLQATAYLGPVLVRAEDAPLFELRRESFLGRYQRVVGDDSRRR